MSIGMIGVGSVKAKSEMYFRSQKTTMNAAKQNFIIFVGPPLIAGERLRAKEQITSKRGKIVRNLKKKFNEKNFTRLPI